MRNAGAGQGAVAPSHTTLSRRAALGRLAAAGAALPATAAIGSARAAVTVEAAVADAALIAHCGAFDALERRFQAAVANPDDDVCDEMAEQVAAAQRPILDAAGALRAATIEGVLARARTLFFYDDALNPAALSASQYVNERLLGFLLRDLADLASRAPLPAARGA